MTVTQRLMKPGSWRLELIDDYPYSAVEGIGQFDHIVITATHLDPIAGYSDANVLANAIYLGPITSRPSPRIMAGADLSHWLGTANGLGDLLVSPVTLSGATLSDWITALCPSSIAVGTVTNAGTSTLSNTYQWITRREAIDAVCRSVGAEWRVNPDGTIDAAATGDLFVSSPEVVVTRKVGGVGSGVLQGVQGSLIVTAQDVEQYTTEVIAVVKGEGTTVPTATATGSTSYVDLFGNPVVMQRFVNSPTDPAANASQIAAATLGQYNAVRQELSLASSTYTVSRIVQPGDWVYVFDQLAGLVDPANQYVYRGELINPQALRVFALTWPIERGMGVYVRHFGSPATYVDLTNWVQWEDADVQWEVGAASRQLADDVAAGSTAYLGANPAVAERATDSANPWTAPGSFLNSWADFGAGTRTTRYRRVGDRVEIEGLVTGGTLNATVFTLPAGYRPPLSMHFASQSNITFGLIYITSTGDVQFFGSSNAYASLNCSFSVT